MLLGTKALRANSTGLSFFRAFFHFCSGIASAARPLANLCTAQGPPEEN